MKKSLVFFLAALWALSAESNGVFSAAREAVSWNREMIPKEAIFSLLNELETNGRVSELGGDELRLKYVNLQGCVEQVLACLLAQGEIDSLVGAIHTPMPATPLCVRPDADPSSLLDPAIRTDPEKLWTVRSRATILREYLQSGGKLYVVYPKGGLEKRNAEQRAIYREALAEYGDRLIDQPLSSKDLAADLVGATYLFRVKGGEPFAFSILGRQANDLAGRSEWVLWLGPLEKEPISARVNEVFDALVVSGGPDLRDP